MAKKQKFPRLFSKPNKIEKEVGGLFVWFLYSSVIISSLVIFLVLFTINNLPPVVPLLYGLAEGQQQLVDSKFLVIPPFVGFAVSAINFILSRITKDIFIKRILLSSCLVVSILLAITVIKIIFLVGSF